jgi:hypothetical protein
LWTRDGEILHLLPDPYLIEGCYCEGGDSDRCTQRGGIGGGGRVGESYTNADSGEGEGCLKRDGFGEEEVLEDRDARSGHYFRESREGKEVSSAHRAMRDWLEGKRDILVESN